MAKVIKGNQIHPPTGKSTDALGNDPKRVFLKKDQNTFLWCKGPSSNAVDEFLFRVKREAKNLHIQIVSDILILPGK